MQDQLQNLTNNQKQRSTCTKKQNHIRLQRNGRRDLSVQGPSTIALGCWPVLIYINNTLWVNSMIKQPGIKGRLCTGCRLIIHPHMHTSWLKNSSICTHHGNISAYMATLFGTFGVKSLGTPRMEIQTLVERFNIFLNKIFKT